MSNITKKAIAASFMELLEKTPLDKITVKDIVESCEINRNTFYYHFQDIYALIDWIFTNVLNQFMQENEIYEKWQDGFLYIADYFEKNKKIIYNLYNSGKGRYFDQYLYRVVEHLLTVVIGKYAEGTNVSAEDIKFVVDFYKYALVGLIFQWIAGAMEEDPKNIVEKIERVFCGHMEGIFTRCKNMVD